MAKTKPAHLRAKQGRRADGKTATSISVRDELLDSARKVAEADGRSLSNWLEQLMKQAVEEAIKKGVIPIITLSFFFPAEAKAALNALLAWIP